MCVRVLVLAACLVLTTPAAALAQLRLAPDWAETPDGERLSHHYPLVAERLALEGRALLSCRVTIPTGVLKACAVVEEQPKGLGFGEAAMAMTRDFQMRAPLAPGDRNPDDTVRIPIRFALPAIRQPVRLDPDPARLAPARRIAGSLRGGSTDAFEAELKRLVDRPQRGVEPATRAAAAAAIRKSQGQATAETEEGMARILASRLSVADLEKAAAFLASPEGQRYLSFPDGLAAAQSAITAEARRRMETTARDTFCARLNCKAEPATEVLKAAMAADPPPEPVIVWDRRPTPDALGAAWPLARHFDLNGLAWLVCGMGAQGAPEDCRVVAESPDGLGVGQAALSVSDRYRLPAGEVPRLAGREVLVLAAFLDVTARNRRTYPPPAVTPARRELARRLIAALNDHWERPAWREALDAEIEGLAVLPAEVRDAAAAALTSGYQAADRAYQELMLDAVAATMDDATLEAAVRFETGDGAPFRRALAEASDDIDVLRRAAIRRIAETARADFCRSFDCGLAGSQPSAASSAPSTRTP